MNKNIFNNYLIDISFKNRVLLFKKLSCCRFIPIPVSVSISVLLRSNQ